MTNLLVISAEDLSPQRENQLLYPEGEDQDLNSTIIPNSTLSRTTSLESSLNKISLNSTQLTVDINSNKRGGSIESPEDKNSTRVTNPIKRLRTAANMLPLTSDIVKNDFHIVDIVSDDDATEFLTPTQGNSIYTAVLKEILKAEDISNINFEDSFNDREHCKAASIEINNLKFESQQFIGMIQEPYILKNEVNKIDKLKYKIISHKGK
ncbi:hypothetical protein Bhyg_07776, partial [Pseudolycoriella hygida]